MESKLLITNQYLEAIRKDVSQWPNWKRAEQPPLENEIRLQIKSNCVLNNNGITKKKISKTQK